MKLATGQHQACRGQGGGGFCKVSTGQPTQSPLVQFCGVVRPLGHLQEGVGAAVVELGREDAHQGEP